MYCGGFQLFAICRLALVPDQLLKFTVLCHSFFFSNHSPAPQSHDIICCFNVSLSHIFEFIVHFDLFFRWGAYPVVLNDTFCSVLKDHFWQGSGNYMWCQGSESVACKSLSNIPFFLSPNFNFLCDLHFSDNKCYWPIIPCACWSSVHL